MKTGIGTRPCSCTANLAHVHENWAKTWCAHVILAKKRVWAETDMWGDPGKNSVGLLHKRRAGVPEGV